MHVVERTCGFDALAATNTADSSSAPHQSCPAAHTLHHHMQVRFLARGFSVPGDHMGQTSSGLRFPYGPVAIITPFNFPLEIPALQLMGALYMGNKPLLHVDRRWGGGQGMPGQTCSSVCMLPASLDDAASAASAKYSAVALGCSLPHSITSWLHHVPMEALHGVPHPALPCPPACLLALPG